MSPFRDLQEGRALRRNGASLSQGGFPIVVDYEIRSAPRYGYGKPPHAKLFDILDRYRSDYAELLQQFLQFTSDFEKIPVQEPDDPKMPYWQNRYFLGPDPVSLYSIACLNNPKSYIEIGSGNSTKFIRKAIQDHGLRTRIVSIDPHPRAEIDLLCDDVRREHLEEMDLAVFSGLEAGDILFVDGSHRVFMNSDVSVVFLEILPMLPSGVLIYIDDIYLPYDYPPVWIPRYYSEQYMLAVLLLNDPGRYRILLPGTFVEYDPDLINILYPLWNKSLSEARNPGHGFWLATR
jgi:predicted O-methyltransferase YrrM